MEVYISQSEEVVIRQKNNQTHQQINASTFYATIIPSLQDLADAVKSYTRQPSGSSDNLSNPSSKKKRTIHKGFASVSSVLIHYICGSDKKRQLIRVQTPKIKYQTPKICGVKNDYYRGIINYLPIRVKMGRFLLDILL